MTHEASCHGGEPQEEEPREGHEADGHSGTGIGNWQRFGSSSGRYFVWQALGDRTDDRNREDAMSTRRDAAEHTEAAQQEVLLDRGLDWADRQDFEDASRGFIARLETPTVSRADGTPIWDLTQYAFLNREEPPATVNPSLWRQAQLNMLHGLFKVTDRVYQVRGMDLSVISFIEGDTGWIVIDPLISMEVAAVSLELLFEHVARRPVVAVIYTHSHIDHWGGVKGVTSAEDVAAGRCMVVAPEGFTEAAISENVYAGNAMTRRATYMYGNLLPKDEKGQVDAGLGKGTSAGTVTLIQPTHTVTQTGETLTIDGVEIEFQLTPGTEAPSEFNFYFPQLRALCMAENCTHTLHNLYTLRGAQVRDAHAWSIYMNETIERYADKTDVIFASHHWPCWGTDSCRELLASQRDMYRFLHDQTLHLANQGYTSLEIAETLTLPPRLDRAWHNRGYYGSINHDVKAIYQRYLGWFDGNPANLHPLPPVESGRRYVELAGGPDPLLAKAREAFERGEYRWAAQLTNHLVFADPDNAAARQLEADAFEQLGYQAESGPWRNFYLTGAMELRDGVVPVTTPDPANPDVVGAMSIDMLLDYLAIRLNGERAADVHIAVTLVLSDLGERYAVEVADGVLNHTAGRDAAGNQLTVTTTRGALMALLAGGTAAVQQALQSGQVTMEGDPGKLAELVDLLEEFAFWFDIVTP
jgi:alkyl sulfatase BDS1-like metallo-beta-lactamase superfamily hydrolase